MSLKMEKQLQQEEKVVAEGSDQLSRETEVEEQDDDDEDNGAEQHPSDSNIALSSQTVASQKKKQDKVKLFCCLYIS